MRKLYSLGGLKSCRILQDYKQFTARLAGRAMLLLVMIMLLTTTAWAQGHLVKGKVTAAKDQAPLPGVNIIIKGTTRGVVTDMNGAYTLEVNEGDLLIFSQVGMESKEVLITSQSVLDVSMSETTSFLGEVVVTALGISQEKRSLGYSVQNVDGEELARTQRPNFFTSLQGRVAGLTMTSTSGMPGSSASIQLRGVSSITNGNQPLIVIDGLPVDNTTFNQHNLYSNLDNRNNDYTNRAADINPNDIASVTVLKGPEAAALYGQDGGSGVILITTKRGSRGGKITYDNSIGFQKLYRFPDVQKIYSAGNLGYTNILQDDEINYMGAKYPEGTKIYNNRDAFFKTGFSQIHNIGLEGGSESTTYRFSLNYTDQQGTVPENVYKKLSARLSSYTRISSRLTATTTFNYILSDNLKPVRGTTGFLIGVLAWPANDDMSVYLNANGTRRKLTNSTKEVDNPFFSVYKNHNQDKTNRLLSNMSLVFDPLSWLNITGRFGVDIYSTVGNYFLHPEGVGALTKKGSLDIYTENFRLLNGQLMATAAKDFKDLKTTFMAGTSFDDKNYEVISDYGEKLQLPDFNSINNTDITTQRAKNTLLRRRLVSAFSQLTLNYKDLVYLTATARNDVSSTLPVQSRSFFYPSVSASFVFTELPAVKLLNVFSFGKLRASYAEVGKDVMPYRVKAGLVSRTTTGGGFSYDFYSGNSKLEPERARGYEAGAELKFFNGRLGVDASWYKNDRIKQVSTQRLSYGTGFVFGLLNGGQISVRGFELQLTGTPLAKNDLEWNVVVNFSKSVSKVIELPAQVREYYDADTWLYGNARGSAYAPNLQDYYTATAYPYYNWKYSQRGIGAATAIGAVTYQRNTNGDILINPVNGLPFKTTDFLPAGDRNPDFTLGINNTITYKDVSISFLFDIRKGGDIFNANEAYLFYHGLSKRLLNRETPYIFNGVLKDGAENSATPTVNTIRVLPYTVGNDFYISFPESEFVEKDINWLRLRDITISYSLPAQTMSHVKVLKTASVFTTMTDVFLITNYTGADPAVNGTSPATNGAGAAGFDFGSLSTPRTVTFGVRLGL